MQQIYLQPCSEHRFSIPANIAAMDRIEKDRALLEALVEWSGFSASKLAKEAGLAVTTVTRPLNGKSTTWLSRETMRKLRERFPTYPEFVTGNVNIRSEVGGFGDRPFDEKFGATELPAIPVLGSVIGMRSFDPQRDIELTELDMSEVLDHVRRPASLADDAKAYALTVIGDSMSPKYDPGTRVIVSPKATVSINDYVVVQLKGPDEEDQFSERVTMVLIKRLVRRSASYIELQQFNPKETFQVPADRVAAVHKVIGEVY